MAIQDVVLQQGVRSRTVQGLGTAGVANGCAGAASRKLKKDAQASQTPIAQASWSGWRSRADQVARAM